MTGGSKGSGGRGGLAGLLDRIQRHSQLLALVAVAALAVLVLVPGIGRSGLWDPWEMDRAHVAREMAGPAKALVVERDGAGGVAGPLAAAVEAGEDEAPRFRRVDLDSGATVGRAAARRLRLKSLEAKVNNEVVQLLLVDLSTQVRQLDDHGTMDELVESLRALRSANPGMAIALSVGSLAADPDAVRQELSAAGVRSTLRTLQTRYGLLRGLPADQAAALETKLAGAEGFVPEVTLVTGADDPALAALLDDISGVQRWRAQFRADGELHSVPFLDYALTSLSYRLFGFNETSARLPYLLWGLLGLLVVLLVTRELFGDRAALLATVALVTMPFYVGQARHVSGDISFGVTLAAAIGAFLVFVRDGKARWGWFAVFVASALLAFFSNGLTALLVLWVIAAAYVLAAGDRRRPALVALGSLSALFAVGIALVLGPGEWTFFSQFKFMDRLFGGGPAHEGGPAGPGRRAGRHSARSTDRRTG